MKHVNGSHSHLTRELILFFILLLSISSFIIGLTGYYIARKELNKRGEQILKNSVIQALDLIESEYAKIESGMEDREDAQERIKETLLGPMIENEGVRELHHKIDLGPNGYFIIYDSRGNEVMHPSLEGQNVLDVKDFDDENRFLVQEQIDAAKNGGGYVYYSWWLPHTSKTAQKISYCEYYAPWDWVVVSTAYEIDFNKAANIILLVIILTITALIFFVSWIIIGFVRNVTTPIISIVRGMERVTADEYIPVERTFRKDETVQLIDGYNHMIASLKEAKENIARKNRYITHLAFHDDLTDLPNRHGIEAYVRERLQKECEAASMIQMEIHGLKIINSTLGHKQGDRLLEIIGTYFTGIDNPLLYFARTSSNEFTIWTDYADFQEIQTLFYNLRSSLKEYINRQGFGQIIDMHLAMASYPAHGKDFGELYEKVSMAMKAAKDTNSLILYEYNQDIRTAIENELSMKRYLNKAITDKEISVHYQAQVNYSTGKVIGVEALARWDSMELGNVPPSVFIPAINSQNLVNEFSNYMIDRVLSDYNKLTEKYNRDITVSINITPSYFMDKNFLVDLQNALEKYPMPPGKLTLEITEDIFISDFDKINEIIDHLHRLKVRISIDDFGTGYSSLNYLTKIDLDEMKIDKSFINRILEEPRTFRIFEMLCSIAEVYGYDIVAEGVETDLQLEKIKSTSLRIIQGYLFSRPDPLD